jgi:hypothetical protein
LSVSLMEIKCMDGKYYSDFIQSCSVVSHNIMYANQLSPLRLTNEQISLSS